MSDGVINFIYVERLTKFVMNRAKPMKLRRFPKGQWPIGMDVPLRCASYLPATRIASFNTINLELYSVEGDFNAVLIVWEMEPLIVGSASNTGFRRLNR